MLLGLRLTELRREVLAAGVDPDVAEVGAIQIHIGSRISATTSVQLSPAKHTY